MASHPTFGLRLPSLAHVWPPVLLAILALGFFWPVSLNLGFIPRGGGDLASFLWPTYRHAADALRAGQVPLWSPGLYSGYPFLADNQTAVFYPINLIAYALASPLSYRAVEWLVVFHFWLAGFGMYALAVSVIGEGLRRELAPKGGTAPGGLAAVGLFAGVAYMLSDVFVTHVGNLNIVMVSAWLPWVLWAGWRAFQAGSFAWATLAGALLAVAILAGHAQMALMSAGAFGAFGVWKVTQRRAHLRGVLVLGWVFAVGLGLSALTVLPAIELTGYSARAKLSYDAAARYSLPWTGLAGLVSPLLYGRGAGAFWGPWDRVETGFAGTLPLLLLGLAPYRRNRDALFLAVLGLTGLLIALGPNTPVHRWLYEWAPGFSQLRVPARFILLTDLSIALLGAWGLARVHQGLVAPKRLWGWTVFAAAAGIAGILLSYDSVAAAIGSGAHAQDRLNASLWFAAGAAVWAGLMLLRGRPRGHRWWPGLMAFGLAAELFALGAFVEVDSSDPTAGFRHPAAIEFLKSQPAPTRIDNASGLWQPDTAAVAGLEDIGGISNPLALAAYDAYYWSVGHRGSPQYNFLNAQYVISDKDRPPADSSFVPVFNEDPEVDVYLNTGAMPRVSLVDTPVIVGDQQAAWDAVHAPGFDPATSAVLENAPDLPSPSIDGERNLHYLWYDRGEFGLQVLTPSPAYLVMSEVWYPGWEAAVDGEAAPVYRANYAFRAVLVPAGSPSVDMRFRPRSWAAGLAATLITATGVLAGGLVWTSRRWPR